MKILVKGPLLSISGYGIHARQVLEAMQHVHLTDEIYCNVTNWGNSTWSVGKEHIDKDLFEFITKNYISDQELDKIKEIQKNKFDISYQVSFPDEWDISLARKNVGFFAGIETTMCCEKWIDKISAMRKVIVPSCHAKTSIQNAKKHYVSNTKDNVEIIPEWFPDCFLDKNNSNMQILNNIKTENNILIIGQLTKLHPDLDRKNFINTLKHTLETISSTNKSNWGVILKVSMENNSYLDYLKVKNYITTFINIIKKEVNNVPPVYILHGNMTNQELKSLYLNDKVKALATGTRGEGFGLTLLEAGSLGLPVIATNWSAYTEFLECFLKVDYNLVNIPFSSLNKNNTPMHEYSNIWVKESKWAEFIPEDFCKKLKIVINDKISRQEIEQQKKDIINNYNKNAIINIYSKQFGR